MGDDVLRDDPTVQRLEKVAADKLGTESALFVPSGTMGNQVCVAVHTVPGEEFLVEESAHIYNHERGMFAVASSVVPRPLPGEHGVLSVDDLEANVRPERYYLSQTGLICVESPHNRGGGTVYPLQHLKQIRSFADEHDLPVHLDGARIFNAAHALDVDVEEITQHADSVMFCLSKGLSAPVGSIIGGSAPFIEEALSVRKMFGGGMRQAGVLAAAGLVALREMVERLEQDHQNAERVASVLRELEGIDIVSGDVQTNIVIFSVRDTGRNAEAFCNELEQHDIHALPVGSDTVRFVFNRHVDEEDTETVCSVLQDLK